MPKAAHPRTPRLAGALCRTLLAAAAIPTAHLGAQESGGYVTRLGTDTVAVERFSRSAERLEGEIVSRVPQLTVRSYVIEFGPGGRVSRAEMTLRRPGRADPVQTVAATFTRDSVLVETRRDTAVQRRTLALPGTAVAVPGGPSMSWAISEVVAGMLANSRADSILVPAYTLGASSPSTIRWTRAGSDSVLILVGSDYRWMGMLRGNRLRSARPAPGTTQQYAADRTEAPDVPAVVAAWSARERHSGAVGALSPRDTVNAAVGGASILVDYSRPARRGRTIFGSTAAPWGEVWRTGANAATQFSTDRALEIGGVVLAPGTYSLWTIPYPSGPWKLIINGQSGQWGTAYDAARDLYHLDLAVTRLPQPVERFTIRVEQQERGGVLVLEWDATRASIPFTVR